MASSHDDDLDWLYHRDRKPPRDQEPEQTRMLPPQQSAGYDPTPPPPQAPPRPAARPTSRQASQQGWDEPPGTGRPRPAQPSRTPPPPRRGRTGRRVAAGIAIFLAAALVWLIAVPIYAWSHVNRVDYEPSGSRPANQPGTLYLLVGSDSRAGLTKEEEKKLGTGNVAGQRTDTIMLLYVPPGGQPALISIPRDSYVPIPGHGSNKINAAYSYGGAKLLTRTVEQNTGLRVDQYTEVGFAGFVDVIDAVGGVRVCLKHPIKDHDSHLNLKKGCQTLVGKDALGYVRMRKADPLGDLGRVERQRQVLGAMAKKAASPASIVNPVRYWRLANAGTDSLAVGKNASMFSAARMIIALGRVSGGSGMTLTVPVGNANAETSAGSSVLWDTVKAKEMFADIARGDTKDLKRFATK